MADDHRAAIYEDLYRRQLVPEQAQNRESASRILGILFDYIRPKSVLDVGCVLGTWLRIVQEMDVPDIQGIEGEWLDPAQIQIDPNRVVILDLEHGFDVKRRFDLLLCLEVAEHLSASAADPLVASLTAHTDFVLFSAAIPFQGGHGHINEQFLPYWAERFAHHGFQPIDLLRPRIWDDRAIHWWLRQNILLFGHERAIAANPNLWPEFKAARPLSIVHPDLFGRKMEYAARIMNEHQMLSNTLGEGGHFEVRKLPNGGFSVTRME